MPEFTVVANGKDGKTVEHFYETAASTLHDVHALRNSGCHIVTIYRDGAFLSEEDLVLESNKEEADARKEST